MEHRSGGRHVRRRRGGCRRGAGGVGVHGLRDAHPLRVAPFRVEALGGLRLRGGRAAVRRPAHASGAGRGVVVLRASALDRPHPVLAQGGPEAQRRRADGHAVRGGRRAERLDGGPAGKLPDEAFPREPRGGDARGPRALRRAGTGSRAGRAGRANRAEAGPLSRSARRAARHQPADGSRRALDPGPHRRGRQRPRPEARPRKPRLLEGGPGT